MKRLLLSAFLLITVFVLNAQDGNKYADVKLESVDDFRMAEPLVLDAANFILSTSTDDNMERVYAVQLILSWMEDYPDFKFDTTHVLELDDNIQAKMAYLAAMAKYYIDNKNNLPDSDTFRLNSCKLFLEYCENPKNKVFMNSSLKKMMAAKDRNELADEIK